MYSDPSRLRQNVVKIRLSDEEHRLVQALVDYTGEQKATLIREVVIQQALQLLGDDPTRSNRLMAAL